MEDRSHREDISQDSINSLLEPLGLRVKKGTLHWFIVGENDPSIMLLYKPKSMYYITSNKYYSLNYLLSSLFQAEKIILGSSVESPSIPNPYFGCQSLEEATIKKDLGNVKP